MTIELTMLAFSIVLGLVQIILSAQSKNLQLGYWWAAGPRDEPRPALTGLAGRLERALANFIENFLSLCRFGVDRSCCGPPRFDDGLGCATLFLRSSRLPAALRLWRATCALPCLDVATLGILLILLSLAL